MNSVFDLPMISIPISEHFREFALKFAQEQPTQSRQKQVYLNTLAVQVVNYYLQLLEVETDLEASDSWNAYVRLVDDVADLVVPNSGKLECRATIGDDFLSLSIPPETGENRVGYVVINIDKTCRAAKIIGFLKTVDNLEINIHQLQPLEDLIEHLHIVYLRQWLEGIYTQKWVSVEELSRQRSGEFAFRSKRVRGFELDSPEKAWKVVEQIYPSENWNSLLPPELSKKLQLIRNIEPNQSWLDHHHRVTLSEVIAHLLSHPHEDEEVRWTLAEILWILAPNHPAISARRIMDLGIQIVGYPVALMVAILPKLDDHVSVLLRVYPTGEQTYLPTGLKLTGLDQDGQPFLEVQASAQKDDYIQLKFGAEFNERFRVRVGMDDFSITENFMI